MPSIFSTHINQRYVDLSLLIVRLSVGPFMLTHGWPKLMRFFGDEPVRFSDPIGIGMIPSLILVIFAEVICSVLIFFGLSTRLATIPLIITMSVAAFVAHAGDPFGNRETPLLYLSIYILLLALGAGKYSADHILSRKRH